MHQSRCRVQHVNHTRACSATNLFLGGVKLLVIAFTTFDRSNTATSLALPVGSSTPDVPIMLPIPSVRKNGKNWHESRKAFRPTSGQSTYAKRRARTAEQAEVKKLENELKEDKEAERQVCYLLLP